MNMLFKNNQLFITRPARFGEEEILYNLICELAQHEGKDLEALPLTKESLKSFGFGDKPYFQTILYLEEIYVKSEYRQIETGRQLLKQLASYALEKECCLMKWHVFSWNSSAMSFYEKIGGVLKEDLVQVRLEKENLQKLAGNQ